MTRRPIAAIDLPGVEPGKPATKPPEISWFPPEELLVNEAYQRNLSERSIKLIRKIVAEWDWRRFKPPIVAWTDDGLEVIDGQHTAIAAASHPDIESIPVVLVEAAEQEARASAFIGQNRDRLAITAVQMHHAAVAAGDAEAAAIDEVCAAAGARMLRFPVRTYAPGDTLAVAAVGALIRKHGKEMATRVLQMLTEAECAPITGVQIKALELLLVDEEFAQELDKDRFVQVIKTMHGTVEREAKAFAVTHCVPTWKATANVWFLNRNKRKAAPGEPAAPKPAPAPKGPITATGSDVKRDTRPPREVEDGRWAPGNHLLRCADCDSKFVGARRATICADCAYEKELAE